MKCKQEAVLLMHDYLDGDLSSDEEKKLYNHLEDCEACQTHFRELTWTAALLKSADHVETPVNFTANVIAKLPTEKKRLKAFRWFKMHPMLTAAAVFFVLMFGGLSFSWDQNKDFVVSKQENLIIEGDTVIVPAGEVVSGDLLVKNGNLIIHGTVDGDVTLINGELIEEDPLSEAEGLMASVGEVNGNFQAIDQLFDWTWYKIKGFFKEVFPF